MLLSYPLKLFIMVVFITVVGWMLWSLPLYAQTGQVWIDDVTPPVYPEYESYGFAGDETWIYNLIAKELEVREQLYLNTQSIEPPMVLSASSQGQTVPGLDSFFLQGLTPADLIGLATANTNITRIQDIEFVVPYGDGTNNIFSIDTSIGTIDFIYAIRDAGSPYNEVFPHLDVSGSQNVTLYHGSVPSKNQRIMYGKIADFGITINSGSTVVAVTHNLDTENPLVFTYENVSPRTQIYPEKIRIMNSTQVEITRKNATTDMRVVVHKAPNSVTLTSTLNNLVTHNLNNRNIVAQMYVNDNPDDRRLVWTHTTFDNFNEMTLHHGIVPGATEYRVVYDHVSLLTEEFLAAIFVQLDAGNADQMTGSHGNSSITFRAFSNSADSFFIDPDNSSFSVSRTAGEIVFRGTENIRIDPSNEGVSGGVIIPATTMVFEGNLGDKVQYFNSLYAAGIANNTLYWRANDDFRWDRFDSTGIMDLDGTLGTLTVRESVLSGGNVQAATSFIFKTDITGTKINYFGNLYRTEVQDNTLRQISDSEFDWWADDGLAYAMKLDTANNILSVSNIGNIETLNFKADISSSSLTLKTKMNEGDFLIWKPNGNKISLVNKYFGELRIQHLIAYDDRNQSLSDDTDEQYVAAVKIEGTVYLIRGRKL